MLPRSASQLKTTHSTGLQDPNLIRILTFGFSSKSAKCSMPQTCVNCL